MNTEKRTILLVGSPKMSGSSSESLGSYLLNRLADKGYITEKLQVNHCLKTPARQEELFAAVESCDILILAFPLYVDSLPSGVIKAMELLAQNRAEKTTKQVMLAICNSGFPEAHQNDTALAICRCFAKETGFAWAGGLSLGGGGAINGQPLEKLGGMMKNVRKALDLTAQALTDGNSVPEEAFVLFRKSFIPRLLYLFIGNLGWKIQARRNGVLKKINDRPYGIHHI